MHVGTDHVPSSWPALKARLAELGWVDGKNVELIWRNLEPDAADAQATAFVLQRVDVIVAFEDTSIAAAQKATKGTKHPTPIVFLHPSDPVRDGLVASLSRPGRNLTGVFGPRDIVAKQLELYQLLVPKLRRVLTLVDPTTRPRSASCPSTRPRPRICSDRSSWTSARPRTPPTSSASSVRCVPERSTGRSCCRRISGSTTRP